VMPARIGNRRASYAERWWLHMEPRPEMRKALSGLRRYIGTPRLTKHRLFVWLTQSTLPDSQVIVFARDDDFFFGVLHSTPHELWSLRLGTQLETRPRYTATTTFETFPFPEAPPAQSMNEVEVAARQLNDLRVGWLNPPGVSPSELPKRTLTNLYNSLPTWLRQAHERLDRAAHAAYGWPYPLEEDEVLARLLEMNRARSAAPR
jgi:type II restriction/modification system DNA methylase subunit YeeA